MKFAGLRNQTIFANFSKNNSKVLGIATDFKPSPFQSFELCLLDFPEWGEAEEKHEEKLRETLGIYKNQEVGRFSEDEYPSSSKVR